MRGRVALVVAVLVMGGLAWAQANVAIMSGIRWFPDGVFFGPRSGNAPAAARNALAATYESAPLAYDFAALATGTCADSSSVTITGAALGDSCILGMNQALDATATTTVLGCRVTAANAGVVRACAVGIALDGGSTDLPDAGYVLRTFR